MFGTRRLAKRSIVGTRVAAKWQDGRYYPGVIQSQYAEETPFTDAVYTVLFEDGYDKNIPTKSIVGAGFQANATTTLKNGQKVFLTLNGREVTGIVVNHSYETDDVVVSVVLASGDEVEISKRLDELRMLKSRKSARLQDQDTDYSKLADLQLTEPKKRTVSSGIDVPNKHSQHWHSSLHGDQTAMEDGDGGGNVEMMDENIAAMVLTSLSCSPQSPKFDDLKDMHTFNKPSHESHTQLSTSASSSGYYSNQSDRSDPSPPSLSHLSESAPSSTGMVFGPFLQDEGLELDDEGKENVEHAEKKVHKKTMYQCIWPNCGKVSSTCPAIEKHVRDVHLGPRNDDSDSESDNEVDFYCTEIEVNVENVTQGFSDMCTSRASPRASPSSGGGSEQQINVISDHDYQKKEFRYFTGSSVPSTSAFMNHAQAVPIPIRPAEIQRSLSWQNHTTFTSSPSPPIRATKLSPQERLQQHQAQSPKIHTSVTTATKLMSIHKKPRSEVRKCRKVYGMENRDMWCTQCKWKKACTRFLE